MATSDGYALSVVESRSAEAQRSESAVLLLHGRTWSSQPVWVETGTLGGALGDRDRFAMDFRGFGRTPERAADGLLRPSTCASDVRRVVEFLRCDLGYARVDLVGWSYGALVAQLVADAADRLVLYASVWDRAGAYRGEAGKWTCDDFGCSSPTARGEQTLEGCLSDFTLPGTISEDRAMTFALAALAADPVAVDWACLDEFAVDLRGIRTPTLVIYGDRDPDAPAAEQLALYEGIGAERKELATIPGADHVAHVLDTARDEWAARVRAFLDA